MKILISIIMAGIGGYLIWFGINSLVNEVPIWLNGVDINASYLFGIAIIVIGAVLLISGIILFATRNKMRGSDHVFKHKF